MVETFTAHTKPLWIDQGLANRFPQLRGELVTDVVVIGGGITGITAALELKRAGKKVIVVELSRISFGETGHTTGHLTESLDESYSNLITNFGLEGAKLAAQSCRRAIQKIEDNVKKYGIRCDFERVTGYRYTETKDGIEELHKEADAASRIGVPLEFINSAPLPFDNAGALKFEHQAQFHSYKYVTALANCVHGEGSLIYEDTRVLDVEEGEPCRVVTDKGTIVCKDVIVAANVPVLNKFLLHTKIAAYRTYAIAITLKDNGSVPGLFWDTKDPYHYIRSHRDDSRNYIIIGGEDHKTGQETHTEDSFRKLLSYAHERFNMDALAYRWSGQIIEPCDGLPFIGKNPMSDHIYVATGYAGTGLTFGTIAGLILSDQITGEANPWSELYDARRVKPFASAGAYISENFDYPTHLITDRLKPTEDNDLNHIRENEGRIVRIGAKKVAAYRDPEGKLHMLSPVCPHMGCYVNWNEAEKSWDCPCHGSRFAPCGDVLNGPAVENLASEEYDENVPMNPERYEYPEGETVNPLGGPILSMFTCPLKLH
jgi:glycine/D-amino acid oxidase-like deaminating enzyme/nitrite reductase/ring-hydroxylating ferredoxin subunit